MAEIAGSLYILSTAVFGIMAIAIGIRLELLHRRTGKLAERLLGLGIMCTAGLGYMVMMVGLIGRGMAGGEDAPPAFWWITFVGWIFHNIGVVCMLSFTRLVFRPEELWAKVLVGAMTAVLWVSWIAYVADGSMAAGVPGTAYWVMMSVIGTYPSWSGIEAFRYYRIMRRRVVLGLAQPVVVNRFLLWGLASMCAAASIWVINIPSLLGVLSSGGTVNPLMSICMMVTGLFGLATVCLYWLTFFPPTWYLERLEEPAGDEAA